MEITLLTQVSVNYGGKKKKREWKLNTLRRPFSKGTKNCRDYFPSSVLHKSNTTYTKPIPECQKCNFLIEKILNELDKFPALLKGLQASISQTKQTLPPNPKSRVKPSHKEKMIPQSSFQSGTPSKDTQTKTIKIPNKTTSLYKELTDTERDNNLK